MKKYFVWFLIVSVFLCCNAGMSERLAAPVFEWERDLHAHWQLDEKGAVINHENHTLDDSMLCTVCGSEVWDFGDGSGDVNNYDDHGNLLHYTGFEADGTILNDSRHILTYDESGVLVLDLEFIGGVFFGEYVYTADEDGNQLPVTQKVWYDDGTAAANEYDQYGNCIRSVTYEADGSVSTETLTEYALSEDGWFYECKSTSRFASGASFYSEYNQYGDEIRSINTHDDGTVWLDHVYEYGYVDGVKVWEKTYAGSMLVAESFYDEEGCNMKDIEYAEDGSFTVYTYDENGDTVETAYDAEGNQVE